MTKITKTELEKANKEHRQSIINELVKNKNIAKYIDTLIEKEDDEEKKNALVLKKGEAEVAIGQGEDVLAVIE